MGKSTVYFTDFRCPVGTSQLDKLKKLCIAAGIKDIDMDGSLWRSRCILVNLEIWLSFDQLCKGNRRSVQGAGRNAVSDRL